MWPACESLRVPSTLVFAAPELTSGLTQEPEQSGHLEMVQKKAFTIILGKDYESYE